jgi:predicted DNA-binding protein (MmcQ/YjbR family)
VADHRAKSNDPLAALRRICLSLPETTERLSHGEPTWFVRDKKVFVTYANRHHDDRIAFWCAAHDGVQESRLAEDPDRFFRPPYVGHRGWLGVYVDGPVDWADVEDLVEEAYRIVAPARLAASLDDES